MAELWAIIQAILTALGLVRQVEDGERAKFNNDADAEAKAAADAKSKEQADAAVQALANLHDRA